MKLEKIDMIALRRYEMMKLYGIRGEYARRCGKFDAGPKSPIRMLDHQLWRLMA